MRDASVEDRKVHLARDGAILESQLVRVGKDEVERVHLAPVGGNRVKRRPLGDEKPVEVVDEKHKAGVLHVALGIEAQHALEPVRAAHAEKRIRLDKPHNALVEAPPQERSCHKGKARLGRETTVERGYANARRLGEVSHAHIRDATPEKEAGRALDGAIHPRVAREAPFLWRSRH